MSAWQDAYVEARIAFRAWPDARISTHTEINGVRLVVRAVLGGEELRLVYFGHEKVCREPMVWRFLAHDAVQEWKACIQRYTPREPLDVDRVLIWARGPGRRHEVVDAWWDEDAMWIDGDVLYLSPRSYRDLRVRLLDLAPGVSF